MKTPDARRERLATVAQALYGPEWVSPAARDLGVHTRTAQRWASGETDVPGGVVDRDLPALVAANGAARCGELRRWLAVLEGK